MEFKKSTNKVSIPKIQYKNKWKLTIPLLLLLLPIFLEISVLLYMHSALCLFFEDHIWPNKKKEKEKEMQKINIERKNGVRRNSTNFCASSIFFSLIIGRKNERAARNSQVVAV